MYKIDVQRRLSIPKGLLDLSIGRDVKQIVLVERRVNVFEVVPVGNIGNEDKIITPILNRDSKWRIFMPTSMMNLYSYSNAQIYVKGKKLYIELKKEESIVKRNL